MRRCWASLWTARAAAYRADKGFGSGVGIAVVVQRMLESEVSGVMFTGNPLNTATDEILINASWGLGEAIVQGIATDKAKIIAKAVRDEAPKGVQAQIQGDQLRVSGKKKDHLQDVIALLKGKDFGIALQFTNYR